MSAAPQPYPALALTRATLESALALIVSFLIIAVVTLPWLPVSQGFRVELQPEAGVQALAGEDLGRRAVERGLAASARVVLVDGRSQLELSGVAEPAREAAAPIVDLLAEAGYQRREPVAHPTLDLGRLTGPDRGRLPLLLSVQAGALLGLGWILGRRRVRAPVAGNAFGARRALGWGAAAGLVALACSATLTWLLDLIGLPVEEQDWLIALYRDPAAVASLAPWIVLLGPLSEEVFFRGYAFRYIRQEAGFPAGLLVSSALFALIHFNASGFLVYLAIGCTLAWVHHRTNHLLAPVTGHVVTNTVALVSSVAFGPPVGS